eukprot:CAMPEP_0115090326 /NCGR_PEP_ID=MMETSP0227-20121206/25346_1 /TAXON_ID=89957 /ORGANISM="Polarella glacialis, Strain CCMP 1383" /LENGTH=196 /DNA_ID=CAMNT_0002481417 /DNA_START=63 /DNA_END=653 /DNA_ORIENTATION=-
MSRSVTVLGLPASAYGSPKGKFWKGTGELERFPAIYPEHDEVFEEYLANKSMSPSRHTATLAKSAGLLELHYDTMRKRAQERQNHPVFKPVPSMDRAYTATSGYAGLIPGKISNNIVGAPWSEVSKVAQDVRGHHLGSPGSGVTFTLGFKSTTRSSSTPSLHGTSPMSQAGSDRMSPKSGARGRPSNLGDDSSLFG